MFNPLDCLRVRWQVARADAARARTAWRFAAEIGAARRARRGAVAAGPRAQHGGRRALQRRAVRRVEARRSAERAAPRATPPGGSMLAARSLLRARVAYAVAAPLYLAKTRAQGLTGLVGDRRVGTRPGRTRGSRRVRARARARAARGRRRRAVDGRGRARRARRRADGRAAHGVRRDQDGPARRGALREGPARASSRRCTAPPRRAARDAAPWHGALPGRARPLPRAVALRGRARARRGPRRLDARLGADVRRGSRRCTAVAGSDAFGLGRRCRRGRRRDE